MAWFLILYFSQSQMERLSDKLFVPVVFHSGKLFFSSLRSVIFILKKTEIHSFSSSQDLKHFDKNPLIQAQSPRDLFFIAGVISHCVDSTKSCKLFDINQ